MTNPGNEFWLKLGLILSLLVIFGTGYNALISWGERKKYLEGYTSLFVALGVIITLITTIPLVGWLTVLVILSAFIASGLPMILGSVLQFCQGPRISTESNQRGGIR